MRKTAALAVLVLLIGLAALAPGQSVDRGRRGWVAWQRNEVRGGNTDWVALVAVESLDTCREVAQHDAASMFRDLQVRKEVRGVPVAAVSYNGVSIDIEFPDGRHSTVSNTSLPQTAIDLPLGRRDMERALALARWPHSDAESERFHRQYLVGVNGPTVENWAVEQV